MASNDLRQEEIPWHICDYPDCYEWSEFGCWNCEKHLDPSEMDCG